MCSWDEKASNKIQKALEQEILTFINDAQKVGNNTAAIVHHKSTSYRFLMQLSTPYIGGRGGDWECLTCECLIPEERDFQLI